MYNSCILYRRKSFACTLNYVHLYVLYSYHVLHRRKNFAYTLINVHPYILYNSCILYTRKCFRLYSHYCVQLYYVLYRRKNSELYVNQAKVSLVLPVTTDTGNKQFLYLIGNFIKEILGFQSVLYLFLVTIFADSDF